LTAMAFLSCGCGHCDQSWFQQGLVCPSSGALQVKSDEIRVSVPQSLVTLLLRRQAETLKQLQLLTNCNIFVEDNRDKACACIARIRSSAPKAEARPMLAARSLQHMAQHGSHLRDAVEMASAEMEAEQQDRKQAEREGYEEQVVRQVIIAVGDSFSEPAIREALKKEDWNADLAQERLFQDAAAIPRPALNLQKLLEASRAANAKRRAEGEDDAGSSASTDVPRDTAPVPKHVQAIKDVFENIQRY